MTDWVTDIAQKLRSYSEWEGKVFAYQLPEDAPDGAAMIIPPLEGLPLDLDYPNRYEGMFQIVARTASIQNAHALGVDILKKMTLRNVNIGTDDLAIVRCKASSTPVVYPKSDSDLYEVSVTFEVVLIDTRIAGDGENGTIYTGIYNSTAEKVKELYESNPDVNTFTDAEKQKLAGFTGGGFMDYNNSNGAVTIPANTWAVIENDGAGAFTNKAYGPEGVSNVIDTATGAIDISELSIGDAILVRNDYTVTPSINDAVLEFRYALGAGEGAYTLPKTPIRLSLGAGVPDRIVGSPDYIYAGDQNTVSNPIYLQVKCSAEFVLENAGSAIQIIKGF